MRTVRFALMFCLTVILAGEVVFAQDAKITPKQLVSNLENPSGIAVHEGTGHVFVASRYGVYRYNADDHKVSLEVANSSKPTDVYGKGTYEESTKFDIGPLGLAFLNGDHLVVGDGSRKDGDEYVRVYKIGDKAVAKPIEEKAAAFTLGPIKAGEQSAKGEGNFYGVAIGGDAIFVTCNGDDTKGWVAKAEVKDGKPGTLTPAIATKEATGGVDAPVAITFNLDGKQLIVGQMGEISVPGDAYLTTYDPKTGKLIKNYATGLSDIAGLAYSPKTKKLYATDFSWLDSTREKAEEKTGGLYELTIKGDKAEAKKILALDKPAAIAFSKDGSKLYLTTFGTKTSDKSTGGLYVIEAGL